MVFHNIVFANGAYYYKRIIYDSTYQYAFSIAEQIEKQPDYEPGQTPVVFLGEFPSSYAARAEDKYFSQFQHVTGLGSSTSITYGETLETFFAQLLGHPLNTDVSPQQLDELLALPEVQDMPVFPKEGYCRMVDGVMIVRLVE